jgi:hypothetical protein
VTDIGAPVGVRLEGRQLYGTLVGKQQLWLAMCREAVATGRVPDRLSLDIDSSEYSALQRDQRPAPAEFLADDVDPMDDAPSLATLIAADLRSLSETLIDPAPDRRRTERFLSLASARGLVSAGTQLVAPDADYVIGVAPLAVLVRDLLGHGASQSRGFAILTALELSGRRPDTVRSTSISVLFAIPGTGGGTSGELTLSRLAHGPSGLHPDPAVMSFLSADADVAKSIVAAWSLSNLASSDACVVWSVTRDAEPCNAINGESMGAAFAVLLDDLAPRRRVLGRLRRTRIDEDCAVTAGLDGDKLTEVGGYESKLRVAEERRLRVVVAAAALNTARENAPENYSADTPGSLLRGAETVQQAIDQTRTRTNPLPYVVAAAAVVVLIALGVGGYALNSGLNTRERAHETAVAATLATKSGTLANQDSRMAALLALASDSLDPTSASKDAMQNVIQNNDAVVASVAASDGPVSHVAGSSDIALSGTPSGSVTAWSLPSLDPVGTFDVNSGVVGMDAGPDDAFAILDGAGDIGLYQGGLGRLPVKVKTLSTGLSGGRTQVFGPYYSPNGAVIAFDSTLRGAYWEPGMGERLMFDLSNDTALDTRDAELNTVSPWIEANYLGEDRRRAGPSVLLATDSNQVLRLTVEGAPGSNEATGPVLALAEVVPASAVPAPVLSLGQDSKEMLYIGTDNGVQQWDLASTSQRSFPFGGLTERVSAIRVLDQFTSSIVTLTGSGMHVLSQDKNQSLNNSGSADTTGAVTAFSATYLTNYSDYIVAGRLDGRVLLVDPTNSRLTLEPRLNSISATFDTNGRLLSTYALGGGFSENPGRIEQVRRSSVPSPTKNGSDPGDATYLPPKGLYPYVAATLANDRNVVGIGATRGEGGTIWVWDADSTELTHELFFNALSGGSGQDVVIDAAFAPEAGLFVAWNAERGEIGIWSSETWEKLDDIPLAGSARYDDVARSSMSASSDGKRLLVQGPAQTGDGQSVYLVDVESRSVKTLPQVNDLNSVKLSPDGSRIFVAANNSVWVTDADGNDLTEPEDLGAPVANSKWNSDGSKVAVSLLQSNQVVILQSTTVEPVGPVWRSPVDQQPSDLAWSPDDKHLAVTTIVSVGQDPRPGPVQLLRLEQINWTTALCAIAGTDLTAEEWNAQVADDIDRRQLCP